MWGRRLLLILVGVVVVGAFGIGVLFWATGGVASGADEFMRLVSSGARAEAYRDRTSVALRKKTPQPQFELSVAALGLNEAESWTWTSRSVNTSSGVKTGAVEGRVTLKGGDTVQLRLSLVHERGVWKVIDFNAPTNLSGEEPTLPPESELRQLIVATLSDFAAAVKHGDFTAFHAACARPFRAHKSVADMNTAFSGFISQQNDLTDVREASLQFDPPPSIEDGGLQLWGRCEAGERVLEFRLNYIRERSAWRPIGVIIYSN